MEGAQARVNNAQGEVNNLTNKYARLRSDYQKFLQGAERVGRNDPDIKRKREQYQKDMESTANALAKAEETLKKEKDNLAVQKSKVSSAEKSKQIVGSNDPYRKRSADRASAYAANEASKSKGANTKSRQIKNRASEYAANEAARQKASKDAVAKQNAKREKAKKNAQESLLVAKQRVQSIQGRMDKTADLLKRLNKSGGNRSGAQKLAEQLTSQAEQLRTAKNRVSDLESELKKYS